MQTAYRDPKNPGSFGGVGRLLQSVKPKRKKSQVLNYLRTDDAYTLHRRRVRKFKRNRYILKGIDDLWQSDLADMKNIADFNDGYKYILVTIDCFSKFLWASTVKSKSGKAVLDSVKAMKTMRKPKNWQVDKGGEFQALANFMTEHGVNFYTTQNPDTKAAIAERVIQTLKSRIYRYFTSNNTQRYVDVLQDIVHSYNHSKHRTTGMKPIDVTRKDVPKIKQRMYPAAENLRVIFKFNEGEHVRLAKEKWSFERGYQAGRTEEIFTIVERLPRLPPVYRVSDSSGETIVGTFYEQEIQKVNKANNVYKVEKVLKQRKIRRKVEYLIKWLGYPLSQSTWEPAESITAL